MAPFDIISALGKIGGYLVFLLIGMGFGAVLEMSGFGDSRKLAAQFYFKDLTVLKVMFTAIIVAMVLIFAFSALGLLDFNQLYVNPTYLWPGIIGGLIMGIGFIVGGFCPGTSIVALSTLKIDGIFFAFGVAFGAFTFSETVSIFAGFHNSSYMGRFTLPELFGAPAGLIVLLVVFMALAMFYWGEIAEAFFGMKKSWKEISKIPSDKKKIFASAALVFVALFVLFSGQPTPEEKWNWIKDKEIQKLENRDVYIHPGELLEVMNDPMVYTRILDIRGETDYNLFHLENARRVTFDDINAKGALLKYLQDSPPNTVLVMASNNETDSTRAYKMLRAEGIINLYILEGGINNWLNHFPVDSAIAQKRTPRPGGTAGELHFNFTRAVGSMTHAANPGLEEEAGHAKISFKRKVKIQKKKVVSGSCG